MVIEFDDLKLAKRIKELRIASGDTQESFGAKIDMESPNYNRIETGKTTPTIATLIKIANALNASLNQLFEYDHFEDEKLLDKMVIDIYKNYPLKKKQCLYKIMRDIEELQ